MSNLSIGDPGPLSLMDEQIGGNSNDGLSNSSIFKWPPPSESVQGQYKRAGVVTDNGN